MDQVDDFAADLMQRLRAGDEDAMRQVFARYCERLGCSLRQIERRLHLVRKIWEHVHE